MFTSPAQNTTKNMFMVVNNGIQRPNTHHTIYEWDAERKM